MRKVLRNAAEEDERHSVEEEYARAESRRRELEEEKQRAKEEAAVRGELKVIRGGSYQYLAPTERKRAERSAHRAAEPHIKSER